MSGKKRHFLRHLHPQRVKKSTLHPLTTLGLGIACLTSLGILFVTGITLFLYYIPHPDEAYERILHISGLPYGRLIRDLHYLSANALLIFTLLHVARVFLTGSYKRHSFCWVYGLVLLFLVLLGNFTGYVLPWDQVAFWALKVGTSLAVYVPGIGLEIKRFLLAGEEIGGDTLLRCFSIHAGLVPFLLLIFSSLHIWRIRKDGGLAAPPDEEKKDLPADPWLYRAEGAAAFLTLSGIFLCSLFLHAPIHERANPFHPPNPAKAPWYFVGFQEMVSHSAVWGGIVVPGLLTLFLVLAPFLDRSTSPGGRWFSRDRMAWNLAFLLAALSQIGFILIGRYFRGENWVLLWPW